jgi:hypothetical protein
VFATSKRCFSLPKSQSTLLFHASNGLPSDSSPDDCTDQPFDRRSFVVAVALRILEVDDHLKDRWTDASEVHDSVKAAGHVIKGESEVLVLWRKEENPSKSLAEMGQDDEIRIHFHTGLDPLTQGAVFRPNCGLDHVVRWRRLVSQQIAMAN